MAQPTTSICPECNREVWKVYTVTVDKQMKLVCLRCKWGA
jgi:transcription elongation factor Elf1